MRYSAKHPCPTDLPSGCLLGVPVLGCHWQDSHVSNWFVLAGCHLEPFAFRAPEPLSSSPLFSLLFCIGVSLLAPVQIIQATASPTNGAIPKTPLFSRLVPAILPRAWAVFLRDCSLGGFRHPTHVCAVDLQELVFEVCRWDGCRLCQAPADDALVARGVPASQADLLLSGSTGHRADLRLTHHVSFSSRPC